MRILHLSKFYPPDPGGLEQVVACLAEGAAARGHEVRVVCATGSRWLKVRESNEGDSTQDSGVSVVRLPTPYVLWSQPVVPAYVSASRWPADVVYLHRPHPLADIAVALGPTRPTIIQHHSDVQRQRLLRWVYGPLARSVAHRADAVVFATRSHQQHAKDVGDAGRDRAVIIPFGVDAERFSPEPDAARPSCFPPSDAGPVGLFVGRLVGYKGLDVLIDAVEGSDLRVVIVGDGPLRPWLERQLVERLLGDRVVLAGRIPDEALPVYHKAADYFILPSTTPAEMFGIVQLEAMACGRPVISTALSTGVREVNQADVTGLVVPPGDASALRAAMERLSGDPELRARYGQAGRKRVEELFTVERMIEAHLELCGRLVSLGQGVVPR